MYSANIVAKEIIIYSNEQGFYINNFDLQITLYFIQEYFLIECKRCCFDEKIEFIGSILVVPSVYKNYIFFGAVNIPSRIFYIDSYATKYFVETNFIGHIESKDKKLIHAVVDMCRLLDNEDWLWLRLYSKKWTSNCILNGEGLSYEDTVSRPKKNKTLHDYFKRSKLI